MSDSREAFEAWIEACRNAPVFSCGRLDMSSYDAETGEPQRYVYVEGSDERYEIRGRWCDEIAFAATDYRRIFQENIALKNRLEQCHYAADCSPGVCNLDGENCPSQPEYQR